MSGFQPAGHYSARPSKLGAGVVEWQLARPAASGTDGHFNCTGCNYDNNGNMLSDGPVQLGGNTYSWDAEGNLSQFNSGGIIVYDALGRRVEQPGTQIVYGIDGGKLALMNHQTVTNAYAPLPGGGTAVYGGSTLAWYRHPDWLGSSGVGSTTGRAFQYDRSYSPFGDVAWESATVDRNFTGQNQDLTGILYDFPAREYSQGEGRWISPDPAGIAAVDSGNPQSWNRYAYVNNNPLSLIDPTGLDAVVYKFEGGCLYSSTVTTTWRDNPDNHTWSLTPVWSGWLQMWCRQNPPGQPDSGQTGPGQSGGDGGGGAQTTNRCSSGARGFGAGWIVGTSAAAGLGPNGKAPFYPASAAAAYGGGSFSGEGQSTQGTFGSAGVALTANGSLLNYPANRSGNSNATAGAFAGAGGGLFITNAGNTATLLGAFTSYLLSVGPVGIEYDFSPDGTRVLSVTLGRSVGLGATRLQTNTFRAECR